MEANYQALLTGDVAAFDALVQQLMSADNAGRKQAESLLEQLKQHSTDLVVGNLIRLMRQSQNVASRDMSAVMLRKVGLACCWVFCCKIMENFTVFLVAGCHQGLPLAKNLAKCSGTCILSTHHTCQHEKSSSPTLGDVGGLSNFVCGQMQGFIKTELLNCLREEQKQTTLKKVCSILNCTTCAWVSPRCIWFNGILHVIIYE